MTTEDLKTYIGYGLIFPLQLERGRPVMATGFDLIESNIKILLSWSYFTRWYEWEYGSRINELLEEPNDNFVLDIIRRFVIGSITEWEKRVELISAEITRTDYTLYIKLKYQLKNTDLVNSMVYPFYQKIAS